MQKILPFKSDILLKSYSFLSHRLSMLEGSGVDVRNILYNHFVTLVFGTGRPYLIFLGGIPSGGHLRDYFESKTAKIKKTDVHSYLKDCLSDHKYAVLNLNAKELSNISFDREWFHDWLIYGFDDELNCFWGVGYDVDTKNHAFVHKAIKIDYSDFQRALPEKEAKIEQICIVKKEAESLNLRKIKSAVFLFGYNLLPLVFNAKVYRNFSCFLRFLHKKSDNPFDLHQFRVLVEHKTLMLQMMTELVPGSLAAEKYKAIQSTANIMLMTALKYNMRKKNKAKAVDDICAYLQKLRKDEPHIFRTFYKELKAYEKAKR